MENNTYSLINKIKINKLIEVELNEDNGIHPPEFILKDDKLIVKHTTYIFIKKRIYVYSIYAEYSTILLFNLKKEQLNIIKQLYTELKKYLIDKEKFDYKIPTDEEIEGILLNSFIQPF